MPLDKIGTFAEYLTIDEKETGSLGAMAIPIAKAFGLYVITNGNSESKDRVINLGVDHFIDYKKEDYSKIISNVDYVLDTLGDKEISKEYEILKNGGALVSLRGMPNGTFAKKMNMPFYKQLIFKAVGNKYDKLAKKKNQTYDFIFVHSSGKELEEVSKIFEKTKIRPSIDRIYTLDEINDSLEKAKKCTY